MRAARLLALLLGLAVFPGPTGQAASSDASLARLADAFAREVAREARGRAVELSPTLDRTGRGASLALDFDDLARARVGALARLASDGPRLQVRPVLAEAPGKVIVSARLVEQPSGELQDVLSVSIEADAALLALSARPPAATAGQVDLVGSSQSAPIAGRVLDMAFMGEGRLLVLSEDDLELYRWSEAGLLLATRRRLTGPLEPVRHAGGLLRAVEREHAAWAATSRAPGALLFAVEDGGLVERQRADAVPWPGSSGGLRFRPGTDLIEGVVEGLGNGPFLHLDETGVAVDRDGRLLSAGGPVSDLRVGPPLATLWPRQLAASTAAPPGERDTVLILSMAPPNGPRVIAELPVAGSVRALAAQVSGHTARLVAAVESAARDGSTPAIQTHLVVFDLATPGGRP